MSVAWALLLLLLTGGMMALLSLQRSPLSFRLVVAFCVALGLLIRLVLVIQSGWRIDYDEGMIGLLNARPLTLTEIASIAGRFVMDSLPRLVTDDPAWRTNGLWSRTALLLLYYAGIAALLVSAWRRERRSQPGYSVRLLLSAFVITVPIVFVFGSYGRNAFNEWGVDATGRYVLMLHTALPIGLALLAVRMSNLRKRGASFLGVALVLLALSLNLRGLQRLDPVPAFDSPYYDRLPPSLDPLIAYLDEYGIHHIWADAGIAHVLMFQTQERILAADYYDTYIAGGPLRFPDVLAAIEAASRTAFFTPIAPGQQAPPFQRALDAAGVAYTIAEVPPNVIVYIPAQRVDPSLVAAGLGYQY